MSTAVNSPPFPTVNRADYGGTRLLMADLWTAWMLVAEGDYRCLARLFGIRRDQTTMVTLIGAMMLAHAASEQASKAMAAAPPPSLSDAALGSGIMKEGLHIIAGPASRDVPLGSLIALVVIAKLTRPGIRRSAHAIRSGSHLMHEMFTRRYGHLIGLHAKRPHLAHVPQRLDGTPSA